MGQPEACRAVGAEMGLNAVLAQYPQESTQTIARRALSARSSARTSSGGVIPVFTVSTFTLSQDGCQGARTKRKMANRSRRRGPATTPPLHREPDEGGAPRARRRRSRYSPTLREAAAAHCRSARLGAAPRAVVGAGARPRPARATFAAAAHVAERAADERQTRSPPRDERRCRSDLRLPLAAFTCPRARASAEPPAVRTKVAACIGAASRRTSASTRCGPSCGACQPADKSPTPINPCGVRMNWQRPRPGAIYRRRRGGRNSPGELVHRYLSRAVPARRFDAHRDDRLRVPRLVAITLR